MPTLKFIVTFSDEGGRGLNSDDLKSVILDGLGFPPGLDDQLSVAEVTAPDRPDCVPSHAQ